MAANALPAPITLAPNVARADHEITLKLVDNLHVLPSVPSPIMKIGQTIRYSCADGPFRVVYMSSSGQEVFQINDSQVRRLEITGSFKCRCFVTRKDGTEVGWDPRLSPQSGGDPEIKPRP